MPPASRSRSRRPRSRALPRYAAGWIVAGALVTLAVLAALRLGGEAEVSLPPLVQTELTEAATASRCELREERRGERLEPPVVGPRAAAARPGAYSEPLDSRTLVGALRVGTIVIHYRPPLGDERIEQLRRVQAAVPGGTIVAPNPRMRYVVAVTGWRRLLGCPRFADGTLDAVRLFQGRFVGSGPDR